MYFSSSIDENSVTRTDLWYQPSLSLVCAELSILPSGRLKEQQRFWWSHSRMIRVTLLIPKHWFFLKHFFPQRKE